MGSQVWDSVTKYHKNKVENELKRHIFSMVKPQMVK